MKQKSQKGAAREQLFFYQIIGALEWQKQRRVYISVKNCGHEESKWLGQCPMCKEWNTFAEEKVVSIKGQKRFRGKTGTGSNFVECDNRRR